ncbi:FHA domain-containing protein [Roseisolibacter sp. H3M3-2]|uniref:FHA domain-containing protein n=1 Tax=Roseisolibacter sp. H3M3-2 TaxID=3031323 RepID=UPI0023DA3FEF|nr:FHA domain-containing protein [Roseisolibacter sp. H3M3-2]MDF1503881.1 FHA domain-containing protein [Roseisolibacter sp. H3M3-2]
MPSGPVAAAIVLALAVLAGGVYLFFELRHHDGGRRLERQRDGARLPLFGTDGVVERNDGAPAPSRSSAAVVVPRTRPTPPAPSASPAAPAPAASNGNHAPRPERSFAPPEPRPSADRPPPPRGTRIPRARPSFAELAAAAPAGGGSASAALAEAMHHGESLRFAIPDEGTLQFLPGRLEVVSGPDRGREVRFVRTGPGDALEITFGRSEGPPYRHVQLMARTVSRQHAAMQLADGHWGLRNMSATNPVLLNGRALEAGEVAPLLVEGDRIEMGEVVFVFHER